MLHHTDMSSHMNLFTACLAGDSSTDSPLALKCTVAVQEKALSHSAELFDAADTSKDGKLQLGEVREILRKSSEDYSHFAEHARFLDGCALPCHPAPEGAATLVMHSAEKRCTVHIQLWLAYGGRSFRNMCLSFDCPASCTFPLLHNMHRQSLGKMWPHSERLQAKDTQNHEV